MPPDDPTLTSGDAILTQLGPYKLETRLGAGGMGEVFRATDTRLHRTVAIKVLPRDKMTDPERKRRFLQEARAASALNHPNIVTLHDISSDRGIDYLVLECVPGKTLKQRITEGAIDVEDLQRYGGQAAAALAAAHTAGIVHRDIKPANIMITPEGQIKVLDFGLAKLAAADESPDCTIPGYIMGTAAYMSPEQTRGEPADARSDIFSLGVVLYEAATGKLPWSGRSTLELMHAIATEEAPPPGSLRPNLPLAFDRVVAGCLRKEPSQRFQSMTEVMSALQQIGKTALLDTVVAGRKTVAVLPFRMFTGNSEHQFLTAALADAVVNRLGATGRLLVRPTSSVMRYQQAEAGWVAVAREMNVDIVVEGSIQEIGTRVRVLVQAHQAADAATLHAAKHDGDTEDLFGLQDRIADAVCRALAPEAEKPAAAVAPTRNRVAYEFYMRAVGLSPNLNKWDTQGAIEMLERATNLDPDFADAWARLAQACIQMGVAFDSDPRWFQRAETAVARSLELDGTNSDAHCARGQILWTPAHGYQTAVALRALNAALRMNPGCHTAQIWRGLILWHLGLHVEAQAGLQEALAADPADPRTLVFLGQGALYQGQYDEAYDYHLRALAIDPSSLWPNLFVPVVPIYLGRPGDALERVRLARKIVPDEPILFTVEAMAAAYEGDCSRAQHLVAKALDRPQSLIHTHHLWHYAASVYAMCGQTDAALLWLRRCSEMGLPNYQMFGSDPHLRSLRNHPEFLDLMSHLRQEYEGYQTEFGAR